MIAYIGTKNAKQRVAVHKKWKIIEKYQEAKPLAERIATKKSVKDETVKQTKAANKIQKIVRGTVKFETKVLEKAFKGKVMTISVIPKTLGSTIATDIDGFVARAYLLARRYIPKYVS